MIKRIFNLRLFSNLIILVLTFSNVFTVFAQNKIDEPKLTEVERKEAQKIAVHFAVRFSQTKNLNSLIKEFFSKDFLSDDYIEKYKTPLKKETDETVTQVPFSPGIDVRVKTLKSLSNKQWKRLYISVSNFILSENLVVLKETAFKNKMSDDAFEKFTEKLFPAKLKKLFAANPNLIGWINDDLGKSKPVDSKSELENTLETLERGTDIFNEAHKNVLTKALIERIKQKIYSNRNGSQSNVRLEISDGDNNLKIPKGTRIIIVISPLVYTLYLTKEDGKLKIVSAEPDVD